MEEGKNPKCSVVLKTLSDISMFLNDKTWITAYSERSYLRFFCDRYKHTDEKEVGISQLRDS